MNYICCSTITNAPHCISCVLEGSVDSTHHEHVMFDNTSLMGSSMAREPPQRDAEPLPCIQYLVQTHSNTLPFFRAVFVSEPWSVPFLRCSKLHSFQHHRQRSGVLVPWIPLSRCVCGLFVTRQSFCSCIYHEEEKTLKCQPIRVLKGILNRVSSSF